MPDIVSVPQISKAVLLSCDLAADHRKRGVDVNTPESSDKALRWRLRSLPAAAGLARADEERLLMLLNLEEWN